MPLEMREYPNCCIAVELLGGVEMNLSLKFRPLLKGMPCKKNHFRLNALQLFPRRRR
jgi:hypothetical protein